MKKTTDAAQRRERDREITLDVMRDTAGDKTVNPSLRVYAAVCLDYMAGNHFFPAGLKYPSSEDDADFLVLRNRLAALLQQEKDSADE